MVREYTDDVLQKLQREELGILKDFIRVCEENDLSYFGLAGTGIGALRHKGFIPWDDDIDVGLLRKDYEKVLEIFKRDFSDKYTVVNGDEFDGYPLMTTRICIKGSEFREYTLKNIKCPLGIFLDVYAFDNVAKDAKARARQMRGAWIYSKLLICKHIPFPVLPFAGIKGKLVHFVTGCVHLALNVFFISHKFLFSHAKSISASVREDTGVYGYFCDTSATASTFAKEDLFPLRKEKFEEIEVCFPKNLEKSLTEMYGDFMALPPEEKRKNHYPYKLSFKDEI